MALARAICHGFGSTESLDALIAQQPGASLLEINEAGTLHDRLGKLPGYSFASYPECDMMALPFADGSFQFAVHSDTLEHVPDPRKALSELRRILTPGGMTIFTVPIIVGRLSRSRHGLTPSYHGDPANQESDLLVHTEFGADIWTMILSAGFSQCTLVSFMYPAGIAIVAMR
jgi:SAM-dependent methyltransferase